METTLLERLKLPIRGTLERARVPLVLVGLLLAVCAASVWNPPAGRFSWALEVVPGLAILVVLAAVYRRFPVSNFVWVCVCLHVLILNYGGIYTYARTPLGNWARDAFDLGRNHYDRVGHLALGFFPVFLIREALLRRTPLRPGGWLIFLQLSVVLAIGAFWELLEWWVTLIVSKEAGDDFLGSQGDIWDAQWDMALALVGAIIALPLLSWLHDRSMAKLAAKGG